MEDAASKLDGLSTVFNNAGASNLSQVHDWPVEEWDRIVRLNLGGVFHGIKATAPHLLAGGGGNVYATEDFGRGAQGDCARGQRPKSSVA